MIRVGNGQPTIPVSIPGSDEDVPLVRSVQSASGVHPSCPVDGGVGVGLFLQGMVGGVRFK